MLRQLNVLERFGQVTTIGYGEAPPGVTEHLEIDASLPSLPQTPLGVLKLVLRAYRSVALEAPAIRRARELLADRTFDLVVANEARALPLAHAIAQGAPIWGDMHEWAPQERTHVLSWRLLVAPFMTWVCATYLPHADAITSVNASIARLYDKRFGVHTQVVRSAGPYRELSPSPMKPERIRLVHSGGAVPGRNIEALIEAVTRLDDRFTLDLYLVRARASDSYGELLEKLAATSDRVTMHDPVPPEQLPDALNDYDIGVFSLPPHTTNHRLMLPNKFFDFVQARLGLVFSTAVETDALIQRYELGRVAAGYTTDDLVAALKDLTTADVEGFKANAHRAAAELSSQEDERVEEQIVSELLARSATR